MRSAGPPGWCGSNTPSEVVDVARGFLTAPFPRGRRVAIVGDSGGQSGIAADMAAAAGLTVPQFPRALSARLAQQLPAGAACTNPIDLAGAGEQDLQNYATFVERVIADGRVDAVVMTGYFGCYGQDSPALADAEVSVAERLGAVVSATGDSRARPHDGPRIDYCASAVAPGRPGVRADRIGDAGARRDGRCATGPYPRRRPTCGHRPARPSYPATGPPGPSCRDTASPSPPGPWCATPARWTRRSVSCSRRWCSRPAGWNTRAKSAGYEPIWRTQCRCRNAFEDMRKRLGSGDYVLEEQDARPDAVEVLVGGPPRPAAGGGGRRRGGRHRSRDPQGCSAGMRAGFARHRNGDAECAARGAAAARLARPAAGRHGQARGPRRGRCPD